MKKTALYTLLTASVFALTACGGGEKAAEPSKPAAPAAEAKPAKTEAAPAAPVANKLYFEDAAALRQAQDSLKALPQFAGKPLKVFQNIEFYENAPVSRIEVNVQDPNKPENIDHYTYKFAEGKWSEPSPVKISGDGDMSANLTELDKIDFAVLADKVLPLLKQKVQEEKLENIKKMPPEHVSFIFWVPNQSRYWQTNIQTDRASYWLTVNTDGSLKEFRKE